MSFGKNGRIFVVIFEGRRLYKKQVENEPNTD